MDTPFFLSQNDDILPAVSKTEKFAYRYAFARSSDSRKYDDPGQDFLIFHHSATSFLFALCDGVSQSFFGDLAARLLGEALVKWLAALPAGGDIAQTREELSRYLLSLSIEADEMVRNYSLPPSVSPLLRGVLEEKREKGSEATFVSGRIDLPGKDYPNGRFLAAWMGDSRLRIWNGENETSQHLGGEFKTSQRWSSKRGAVDSSPHVYISPLHDHNHTSLINRWQTYSDGLSELDRISPVLSNNQLREYIIQSAHAPQSDDISYLEIWLGNLPENVDLNSNMVSLESPTISLDIAPPDANGAKTVLGGFNYQPHAPGNGAPDHEETQGAGRRSAAINSPTKPIK